MKTIKTAIDTLEKKVEDLEAQQTRSAPLTVRQLEDPRDFEIILANGERTLFHIPATIYQGVYKTKTEYRKGDVVTFDGGSWVCRAERTTYTPATSSDWTLAVRKGRDAKSKDMEATA